MSSLVADLMGDMIDVNLTGQVTANLIQNPIMIVGAGAERYSIPSKWIG